jgi:hypothetical protein
VTNLDIIAVSIVVIVSCVVVAYSYYVNRRDDTLH